MTEEKREPTGRDLGLWLQSTCTVLVALGAAYASYRHGREFALRSGADETTAAIWPLIVDGLLTIATVELWRTGRDRAEGARWVAWLAFAFGIGMSLCANIAASPEMSVLAVIVTACPPLALLLAVERNRLRAPQPGGRLLAGGYVPSTTRADCLRVVDAQR